MSEPTWITVTTQQGELQAEIVRGLLESQGIPTQLSQEGLGRVYGMGVGPLAEVDILVPVSFQAAALSVLERYQSGDFDTDADQES